MSILGVLLVFFRTFFRDRSRLALENLALRQQLAILQRRTKRPRLTNADRGLWVLLSRRWAGWSDALIIVKPATVIKWHRAGFRRYWAWRSRPKGGRPAIDPEVRALIKRMATANMWGAPRIHGELLKLGIQISEATVSKYMPRRRKPPSQTWRAFLENHVDTLVSVDFFTVPTVTMKVISVFIVWEHRRREALCTAIIRSEAHAATFSSQCLWCNPVTIHIR